MHKFKRILSAFLVAVLLCTVLPAGITAALSEDTPPETAEYIYEADISETPDIPTETESEHSELLRTDYEYMSMLPLEEKKAYLVIGDHDGTDISAVPVSHILDNLLDSHGNHIDIPGNAKVVWSYYKDSDKNIISDDYFVIDRNGTLNLSIFEEYDQYSLEMIVGDGNQLNPDNIRYIVTVYLSDSFKEFRTYELYTQDKNGTRYKIEPSGVNDLSPPSQIAGVKYSVRQFLVPGHTEGKEYYIGVNSPLDEHPFVNLDVITFDEYFKYMQAQAQGYEYEYSVINDKILEQNMNITGAGYKTVLDPTDTGDISASLKNALYFIYRDEATGEILTKDCVKLEVDSSLSYFTDEAYDKDLNNVQLSASDVTVSAPSHIELTENGIVCSDSVTVNRVWLKKGCSPDDEYYYRLNAHSRVWDNANAHAVKAVSGIFNSLKDAADAPDIKEQLIPSDNSVKGYKTCYAEDKEAYFTVFFDDDSIHKFRIIFNEYNPDADMDYIREYSEVPVTGEADPWFRVTGANDINGEKLDTYVIENGKNINIDTMYGYGYQTVFINKDVSSIEPVFWLANSERIEIESIYVNGKHFNAGDKIDFAQGKNKINSVFSIVINDSKGKHTKNYNVSFVKKAKGGQLYVAGPVAPDVRSVFLDEYFEYKHDIFIANTGDKPLKNLRAELNAENAALDPYWTIGGSGNDTLAPCTDDFQLEMASSKYGELSNTAKIRLIPKSENGGSVKGTLKIYSGTELLETINLSGRAQNPKIISSGIDDAVLYVPYSYLITTNNMYDWTDVSFALNGRLPDGVSFYPETGEIYGVPKETGKFEFKVTADFKSETYSFKPSAVSFTMNVKENTNVNVYEASDDNYTLMNSIGTDKGNYDFVLNEYADELFRSEGVLEQFVDLWLNGELLEKGVDYDAESGSTKITVYAQTFKNKAKKKGTNTIAAEFRTTDTNGLNTAGNTNELKKTAQNFRLNIKGSGNGGQNGGNTVQPAAPSNESGSTGDINDTVTFTIRLSAPSGNAVQYVSLELHSTPQRAVTDSNGTAKFRPVEYGSHTLYVKERNGKIKAQKSFEIINGSNFSMNGNKIQAVKGSLITLDMEYDGTSLKFISAKASEPVKTNSPKTSEKSNIILYISLLSLSAAGIYILKPRRNRKVNHHS